MQIYFGKRNLWFWYDWVHLRNSLAQFAKDEHTVLEIGASTREKTEDIARHVRKVVGIELFPERLPPNFGNVEYICGDWQRLTQHISPNSMDIVVSSHVIEHVPDDLGAINELFEVLKPGGVAIISTPNRKRLVRTFIEFFTGERRFPWWEHIREYVEDDLANLLTKSKFNGSYEIFPVVFGIHGQPIFVFIEEPPPVFRRWTNFWEIHLFKPKE